MTCPHCNRPKVRAVFASGFDLLVCPQTRDTYIARYGDPQSFRWEDA